MVTTKLMTIGRIQPAARYAQLDRNPGYWRGRARTCRDFAVMERRDGNDRLADELDVRATEYEVKADELSAADFNRPKELPSTGEFAMVAAAG